VDFALGSTFSLLRVVWDLGEVFAYGSLRIVAALGPLVRRAALGIVIAMDNLIRDEGVVEAQWMKGRRVGSV